MRMIDWRNNPAGNYEDVTLEQAAERMELDPPEIEWAIEEFGRCDSTECVVWEPSEEAGIEFPTAEAPAGEPQ